MVTQVRKNNTTSVAAEFEQRLSLSLSSILSRVGRESFAILSKELLDLELNFFSHPQFVDVPERTIRSIKRRIAMQRMYIAHYSGASYSVASSAYKKVCELGFETLTHYVASIRSHAEYCKDNGMLKESMDLLRDAESFLSSIHMNQVKAQLASVQEEVNRIEICD